MRDIKFEYGFESVNGIIKKVYALSEIPFIREKCDTWNVLPIVYVREWTGLKDKNGVEIYEGDILQWFKRELCQVVFRNGCFGYYDREFEMFISMERSFYTIPEIIGNIHENPELLNQ